MAARVMDLQANVAHEFLEMKGKVSLTTLERSVQFRVVCLRRWQSYSSSLDHY